MNPNKLFELKNDLISSGSRKFKGFVIIVKERYHKSVYKMKMYSYTLYYLYDLLIRRIHLRDSV